MEPKNPNPDPNARPVPFPLGRLAALLAGVLLLWGLAATPLPRGIAAVPEEVPSPSPSPSPVPAEPVRLLAVGDLMVHQPQLEAARRGPDSWDFRPQIAPLADLLREGDLTVGNLEVTLGGGRGGYTGYPVFSAPDDLAETLKEAGFDLLFTANTHCLDRGEAGALRTLEVLDRLDLAHTGTFPASRDPAPAVLSAGGITFAFLSYTYGTNGIPVPSGVRVNGTQEARIAADVRAALGLLEAAGAALREECPQDLLEPPNVQGIVDFGASQVLLRALLKTPPGQHWEVGRRYRLKLKELFDREGMEFAYPHLDLQVRGGSLELYRGTARRA